MNVDINRLRAIIDNYVDSFNDCADCPLYSNCPKENNNNTNFSPWVDFDCANLIIKNLTEENQ